ncbi:MAG TPA: hypothetical protein VF034_16060 [Gemmatimonadaceae bacterium]
MSDFAQTLAGKRVWPFGVREYPLDIPLGGHFHPRWGAFQRIAQRGREPLIGSIREHERDHRNPLDLRVRATRECDAHD